MGRMACTEPYCLYKVDTAVNGKRDATVVVTAMELVEEAALFSVTYR